MNVVLYLLIHDYTEGSEAWIASQWHVLYFVKVLNPIALKTL